MPKINDLNKYPINSELEGGFFLGSDGTSQRKTVNYSFSDLLEFVKASIDNSVTLITFTINNNMHLIMQVQTDNDLTFVLDDNGHLNVEFIK